MKKFIALLMALVMAMSLATVAWADGEPFDLQAAIVGAQAGDTITVTGPVDASEIIVIDKPLTIEGGGNTLTSSAARAINITDVDGKVIIKGLTIIANGERAINIIKDDMTVTTIADVTIDNVTATAKNYAVNVATSAGAAKVTITDSTLTGLNTVNVAGAGAVVSISGGKIVCNDQNDNEAYGALSLYSTAVGATITVFDTDFDIKGDSFLAVSPFGAAAITIDGSNSSVAEMVAEIKYGDNSYLFTSVQDAIDHAVENNKDKVIVLETAVNSGESFTVPAGVKLELPADASVVNGEVVSNSSIGENTLSGNYFVKGTGAGAVASAAVVSVTDAKAPKDTNKDGLLDQVGNVKYFNIAGDNTVYVQVASVGEADMIVYYGNAESVFAYLKAVVSPDYLGNGVAFNNFGEKCGQYDDEPVAGTKYYLFQGVVYKTVTTSATNLMVGNTLTPVEAMPDEFVDHVPAYTYDKDYKVVAVKCAECGTPATLYANWASVPKAAQGVALALGDGRYYVWTAASAGATSSTVESAQTFDAGIAMYVGMSVMAACGSAVVIGKKKD